MGDFNPSTYRAKYEDALTSDEDTLVLELLRHDTVTYRNDNHRTQPDKVLLVQRADRVPEWARSFHEDNDVMYLPAC